MARWKKWLILPVLGIVLFGISACGTLLTTITGVSEERQHAIVTTKDAKGNVQTLYIGQMDAHGIWRQGNDYTKLVQEAQAAAKNHDRVCLGIDNAKEGETKDTDDQRILSIEVDHSSGPTCGSKNKN